MIQRKPSKVQAPTANLPFVEYIKCCNQHIAIAKSDIADAKREAIIAANSPYELIPATTTTVKRGLLLIHGLLDSPYSTRDIGNFFYKQDWHIRSLLLPGHGTKPEDLLNIKAEDWIDCVEYAINNFIDEVDELYLCGISAGATLALMHAYQQPRIAGLFLLSPAFKLRSRRVLLASTLAHLGKIHSNLGWYHHPHNNDYSKYLSFPFNLAHQALRLSRLLQRYTDQTLRVPLFMAVSEQDETIVAKAAIDYFNQQTGKNNQLLVYTPNPTKNNGDRYEYRNSYFPAENILDFSHICIHIHPDNPHYGRQGDYQTSLSVSHQIQNSDISLYQGALTPENRSHYHLRRLTYNPEFDSLVRRMLEFAIINHISTKTEKS